MRTIIAGSRNFNDYELMKNTLNPHDITVVISGGARGADKLGEQWALENNIPIEVYPANWNKHGKSAGYMRNIVMANKAEALVAFWDEISPGTCHMINIAKEKGLKVQVVKIKHKPSNLWR